MYYHQPTNQPLSKEEVLTITGVDVDTVCEENLSHLGLCPIVDKMEDGVLDNPTPTFTVIKGVAIKSNSLDPIDYDIALVKFQLYLKRWLGVEIKRLVQNTGLSDAIFCLSALLTPDKRTNEVNTLVSCVARKTEKIFEILKQTEETCTVEELKQLLLEFEQSEDLHGDS